MPNSVDHDLQRSKDFRKMARDVKNPNAKRRLDAAADRLENRAAQKASKVGRKPKPRNPVASGFTR